MAFNVPPDALIACPRCGFTWSMNNIDGGQTYRCSGCEWLFALTTKSPTGTTNAALASVGATALSVASGGASFTGGMILLLDTGTSAEVLTVTATGSATSIPTTATVKTHLTGAAFGQLAVAPYLSGEQAVQPVSPYPSSQPGTF
jgi:hypothetical protein